MAKAMLSVFWKIPKIQAFTYSVSLNEGASVIETNANVTSMSDFEDTPDGDLYHEEIPSSAKAKNRDHLFTKENASEKGRRGGLAAAERRRQRAEDPDGYLNRVLLEARPVLVEALLDAAEQKGEWSSLSVDKRLYAVIKALEYAVGKPISTEKPEGKEEAQNIGLTIS